MAACRTRADKNNLHCKKISGRERARLESWEARHGDRVRCPRFRAADYCTVSWVVPMTPPKAAVIVVVPVATAVARPPGLVIVATPVLLEFQVTELVMSPKEPSEYVAWAVYCCCEPAVKVWFCGLTEMLTMVLLLTVSTDAGEITLPDFAVMFVVPSATAVASPAVLMVAILVADDTQVTCEVTSPVELSPNVPVAVYCCVAVGLIWALVGERVIETIVLEDGKNCPQLATIIVTKSPAASLPIHVGRCTLIIPSIPNESKPTSMTHRVQRKGWALRTAQRL